MRTATIGRVEEHRRRRIWAGKRTVVAHIMRWTVPALISSLWNTLEEDKLCL
jgi:hypothetical protein